MQSDFDEKDLVTLLKSRDKKAQSHFIKLYYGNMFAIARRYLNNEEDVKDVLQESFIKAIQRIDQFEGKSALKTWLTTIVINNCLMNLRSKKKSVEVPAEEYMPRFDSDGFRIDDDKDIKSSPDELTQNKQNRNFIKKSLDKLPDHYRAIILLRDIEGYSVRETSELLGLTEGNVKSRLHRARLMLKKSLEEFFGE